MDLTSDLPPPLLRASRLLDLVDDCGVLSSAQPRTDRCHGGGCIFDIPASLHFERASLKMHHVTRRIERPELLARLERRLPLEPRRPPARPAASAGKTTLARQFVRAAPNAEYFDLEKPRDGARLAAAHDRPRAAARPAWSSTRRSCGPSCSRSSALLADRRPLPARFLLSAAPRRIWSGGSPSRWPVESRVRHGGVRSDEVGRRAAARPLWLARRLPALVPRRIGRREPSGATTSSRPFSSATCGASACSSRRWPLRRFWTMVAHYHGQIWNASEIGALAGRGAHDGEAASRHPVAARS